MPTPRPLNPSEAKRTLAAKFVGLADRLRQMNTSFGLRPRRVFMVWTQSDGENRGEGVTRVLARVEILPTPKVEDLSAVALNPYSAGVLPVGTLRVSQVTLSLTLDQLQGRKIPGQEQSVEAPNVDFFYEVVEDGRGDDPPEHMRFRLSAMPDNQAGRLQWSLLLERSSADPDRRGYPHAEP